MREIKKGENEEKEAGKSSKGEKVKNKSFDSMSFAIFVLHSRQSR